MTKHITNINSNSKTETQKEALLKHLLKGKAMTGLQAMNICGTMKASTRLGELRRMSWPIQDCWVRTKNGVPVKKYWM
jgi:hypothetical protein